MCRERKREKGQQPASRRAISSARHRSIAAGNSQPGQGQLVTGPWNWRGRYNWLRPCARLLVIHRRDSPIRRLIPGWLAPRQLVQVTTSIVSYRQDIVRNLCNCVEHRCPSSARNARALLQLEFYALCVESRYA